MSELYLCIYYYSKLLANDITNWLVQVVAVGPGHLDEEGKRIPLPVSEGSSVLYSKYAGAEFKGADGTNYIVLRVSDLMAVLS
jgi:co-chaperonin GroES (HSP10)